MDIIKLYNMQKELDTRINRQHGLDGQDLLPQKILALQVELGECANEWRGFKYWSKDQEPRTFKGHKATSEGVIEINPLLEEYIDCLHFVLSIGICIGYDPEQSVFLHEGNIKIYTAPGITKQFNDIYVAIAEMILEGRHVRSDFEIYEDIFLYFLGLGQLLGFIWEQIELAYIDKNAENHNRQDNDY